MSDNGDWRDNAFRVPPVTDRQREDYEARLIYQAEAKVLDERHENRRQMGLVTKNYLGHGWAQRNTQGAPTHHAPDRAVVDHGEQWLWQNVLKTSDGWINSIWGAEHEPDYSPWMTDEMRKAISTYPAEQQNKFLAAANPLEFETMMKDLRGFEETEKWLSEGFHKYIRPTWQDQQKLGEWGKWKINTGMKSAMYMSHMGDPMVLFPYIGSGTAAALTTKRIFGMTHAQMLARLHSQKMHVNVAARAFAGKGRVDYTASEAQHHIVGAALFGAAFGGMGGIGKRMKFRDGKIIRHGTGARGLNERLDVLQANRDIYTVQMIEDLGLQAEAVMHEFLRSPHGSATRKEIIRDVEALAKGQDPKTGRFIKGGSKRAGEALKLLKDIELMEKTELAVWEAHAARHYGRVVGIIKEHYDLLKNTIDPTTSTFTEVIGSTVLKKAGNQDIAKILASIDGASGLLSPKDLDFVLKNYPEELLSIHQQRVSTGEPVSPDRIQGSHHHDPLRSRTRQSRVETRSASGLHRVVSLAKDRVGFRMTKAQKERGLTREEAFKEFSDQKIERIKQELRPRMVGKEKAIETLRGLDKKVGDLVELDSGAIGRVTWVRKDGKMLKVEVAFRGPKSPADVPIGEQTVGVRRTKAVSIAREAAVSLAERDLLRTIKWTNTKTENVGGTRETRLHEVIDYDKEIVTVGKETITVGGRNFVTEITGEIGGIQTTVRRILNGSTKPKDHYFEVEYRGADGEPLTLKSESQWQRELFEGQWKGEDSAFVQRTSLKSTSKKDVLVEVENILKQAYREEAGAYAEFRRDIEAINLFPENAPRNIWEALKDGILPKELIEAHPLLDETILADWARAKIKDAEATGATPNMEAESVLNRIAQRQRAQDAGATTDAAIDIHLGNDIPVLDNALRFWSTFRLGWNDRLQSSETYPLVTDLAQVIFGHTLAVKDALSRHVPSGPPATTAHGGGMMPVREGLARSMQRDVSKIHKKARADYSAADPRPLHQRGRVHEDFKIDLNRHLHARDPETQAILGIRPDDYLPASPKQAKAIKEAADAHDAYTKEMLDYVQGKGDAAGGSRNRPRWEAHDGVDAFKNIEWHPGYVTKITAQSRISLITGKGGKGDFAAFRDHLYRALKTANPTMSDKVAEILARTHAHAMASPNVNTPSLMDSVLGMKGHDVATMMDSFEALLKEASSGRAEGAIILSKEDKGVMHAWIQDHLKLPKNSPRSMRKIRMNMLEKQTYKIDGGEPREVLLSDLFENNLTHIRARYSLELIRKVQEHAILARYTTASYKPKTIEFLFAHLKERIRLEGNFDDQIIRDLDLLLQFFNNKPKFERGGLGKGILIAKQLATDIKLAAFTFAQGPEAATGSVSTGVWNVMRDQIPALQKLVDGVKWGKVSKQTQVDILDDLGYGWAEHDLRQLYDRADYIGEADVGFHRGTSNKIYSGLSKAADPIGRMAHFYHINVFSDRMAVRNFTNQLARIAKKGNIRSNGKPELTQTRLAQMGAKPKEFKLLINDLNKPGVMEFQQIGGKDTGTFIINFDKMSVAGRNVFRTMQMRNIRSVVQRSNLWDHNYNVITDDLGELLTQFRAFGWSSQANHFARNIQARDQISLSNVVSMLFSGALTHIGITGLRYADDPKRRAELLTWDNILKGAMLRAGIFGIWPDAIDLPFYMFTGEAPISPSGIPMITQSAAGQMLGDVRESVTGIVSGDWSKVNRINPLTKMWWFELSAGLYKSQK